MAKLENENMTEDWYIKTAKERVPQEMFHIFKTNLWYRLQQDGASKSLATTVADELLDNLPTELYFNIQEWIDDKPISDIKYHGISIKDIMEQDKDKPNGYVYSFVESVRAMLLFIEYGCIDTTICKSYFYTM